MPAPQQPSFPDSAHFQADEETDFNSEIDNINSKISELEKSLREPLGTVTAENAGYFIGHTDGFESKLSPDTIDSITAKEIKDPVAASITDNSVCSAAYNSFVSDVNALKRDLFRRGIERKKLQTLMDIYQIVINEETDFNSEIDNINSKISELEKSQGYKSTHRMKERLCFHLGRPFRINCQLQR